MILYLLGLLFWFLMWTLYAYWIHRLAHIHSKKNPLWYIHKRHHAVYYGPSAKFEWPRWHVYFFWFGNLQTSLDIWITLTLPLLIISIFMPQYGIPLLVLHYFYEVFFSEYLLDHNPKLTGKMTKVFAWGKYHLVHHRRLKKNYGLLITLWDHVFATKMSQK